MMSCFNIRVLFACYLVLGITAIGKPDSASAASNGATIAAAANLQFVLPELAGEFTEQSGIKLKLVFGSSGNFSRQIRQGAPFDLFMSADESYVQSLHKDGLTNDDGAVYASGSIALAISTDASIAAPSQSNNAAAPLPNPLQWVKEQLANAEFKRFAIANPAHAPYGVIAQQALQYNDLWEPLQPYLVFGENVAQAAQFALSSNAQGGVIAYSLASAPALVDKGRFYRIPAEFHQPLLQRMVILDNSNDSAKQFYQYMQSGPAKQILQKFGFDQPDAGGVVNQ